MNLITNFCLYFYLKYIKEDFSILNKLGKFIIYPLWFINSSILWIISPLFIIEYLIINSKIYKKINLEIQKQNELWIQNGM